MDLENFRTSIFEEQGVSSFFFGSIHQQYRKPSLNNEGLLNIYRISSTLFPAIRHRQHHFSSKQSHIGNNFSKRRKAYPPCRQHLFPFTQPKIHHVTRKPSWPYMSPAPSTPSPRIAPMHVQVKRKGQLGCQLSVGTALSGPFGLLHELSSRDFDQATVMVWACVTEAFCC